MKKRFIAFPLDGYESGQKALDAAEKILMVPGISELIGLIKINDAAHMPDVSGPKMIMALYILIAKSNLDIEVFLDLKVNDVVGTLKNIGVHYAPHVPAVLTVSSNTSALGFLALRNALPRTKLALFSLPTDITNEECLERWKCRPHQKILQDAIGIHEAYAKRRKESDPKLPYDQVVTSPLELNFLSEHLAPLGYGFVVPGIRDKWMTKDHQERTTGIRQALELGAQIVVMGAQIRDGNPKQGISPEKSRKMTLDEINKVSTEM